MPAYEQERIGESPAPLAVRRIPDGSTHVRSAVLTAMRILLILGASSVGHAQEKVIGTDEQVQQSKTPRGREEWVRERTLEITKRLRGSVLKMDADLYAVRQEGTHEVTSIIREMLDDMNPPPAEVMNLFEDLHRKVKAGDLSLEQRVRLEYAGEATREVIGNEPDRIPPLEYPWPECLRMISEQTGFDIRTDGLPVNLLEGTVRVGRNRNDCFRILEEFCSTAGVCARFGAEPGVIILSERKEGDETRIFGEGKILAVAGRTPEGRAFREVRMSPRTGALVAIKNVTGDDGGAVSIGDTGIPAWKFNSIGSLPSRSGDITQKPGVPGLRAECTVVRNPQTVRLACGGRGATVGFQNFMVHMPNEEQPTRIQVNASVFGDVPWPATPCDVDSKTYGAGAASRFRVLDAKGERIPARVVSCEVNLRLMMFTLECEGKPASVDITAYRELDLEKTVEMGSMQDAGAWKE